MPKFFPLRKVRTKIQQVGSGSGFIASVVQAGLSLSNQIKTLVGQNYGVQVDVTRQAGRIDQKPAVTASALGATGSASASQKPAVATSLSPVAADPSSATQRPAVAISPAPATLDGSATVQKPALLTQLLGAVGSLVQPVQNAALAISGRISDYTAQEIPAFDITRISYDLAHSRGATTATTANTSGTGWSNPTNAQGQPGAAGNSTMAGALGANTSTLRLDFADPVSKTDLTLGSVFLDFYMQQSGTVLANGSLQPKVFDGTTVQNLGALITGDVNYLTTPLTFDVSAIINTWAKVAACRAEITGATAAAALTLALAVDAVVLRYNASAIQTL